MSEMTKDEIKKFLLQGTFTGKLGTINKDGTPHVVPIWYTVDEEDKIIFNTSSPLMAWEILITELSNILGLTLNIFRIAGFVNINKIKR